MQGKIRFHLPKQNTSDDEEQHRATYQGSKISPFKFLLH